MKGNHGYDRDKSSRALFSARMALDAYYSDVQAAYDSIAPSYDDAVGRYSVSRRAKRLALDLIKARTPRHGTLLDIGCYTGNEALELARAGFRVVGVDISPEMVRLARSKAQKFQLQQRARFEVARASELDRLTKVFEESFDGAYSVYGTLNLEPALVAFKSSLTSILRNGGSFVCGLLNPTVLYELVLAPMALKFHGYRKLAKRHVRTRIGLGRHTVETFLYSPKEFARLMGPEFIQEEALGLHFLYPPPRGKGVVGGGEGLGLWWGARTLDGIEHRLQRQFPFTSLGFFSLQAFRKT